MKKMSMSEAGRIGWERSRQCRDEQKIARRAAYDDNPTKCQHCGEELPYQKRHNKYCCHSCSASKNNIGVRRHGKSSKKPCLQCGKVTNNVSYCSNKCHSEHVWKQVKAEIETSGFDNLAPYSKLRKRYLLETRGYKCEICGITEWMGKEVPLAMDHINGNSDDNNLTNLRLICHNCDAQTSTYKSRNRGNGRHCRRERYRKGQSY